MLVVAPHVEAQTYNLKVGDIKFLSLKPPMNKSYFTQAAWGCDNINVRLSDQSTVGAIVEVTHYFEGTATITVFAQYVWEDLRGWQRVGAREYFFLIRCIAASSSLNYTSKTLDVGQSMQLQLRTSSYGYTPKWQSSNNGVAQVSYDGRVTAVGVGTTTITCDPIVGPPLSCRVTVKDGGGNDDDDDDSGGGNGDDGGDDGGDGDGDGDGDEDSISFEERLSVAKERLHMLQQESQKLINNNRL